MANDKANGASSNVTNFSILKSAMAAMVGIQSNKNRERDFQSGKFWHFIIAGGIVTILFIATVFLMMKWVMAS